MKDYAKIDTSEKINRYEMAARFAAAWVFFCSFFFVVWMFTGP